MPGARVRLEGVSKRHGETTTLLGIDLEVHPGEMFVLLGASGSGKTTLLELVNALRTPDTGIVRIDGVDISTLEPASLRRGIGYVFQGIGLFPHLDVETNIGITPELLGWPKATIRRRVEELLALMGLPPEFLTRMPASLSGGQRQRVAVARALAAKPPVVLFDEPFAALDPSNRTRLGEWVRDLRGDFTGMFVTHDIAEAFRVGDRIAVLEAGKIRAVGTPAEVAASQDDAVCALLSPAFDQAEALLRTARDE